jgi:hypothetical protein
MSFMPMTEQDDSRSASYVFALIERESWIVLGRIYNG